MHALDYPRYDYRIERHDGKHYTGSVHGDERDWTRGPQGSFPYSATGAHRTVAASPVFFAECVVVRVTD